MEEYLAKFDQVSQHHHCPVRRFLTDFHYDIKTFARSKGTRSIFKSIGLYLLNSFWETP